MGRLAVLILVIALSDAASGWAQTAKDQIRGVISQQIEAFRIDDFDTAFTFASPDIRRIFRTPKRFGQMVMNGYPMVWRPSDVRYGNLVERDGKTYQHVFLRDRNGARFVATYEMRKMASGWRINGVWIEPAADAGA